MRQFVVIGHDAPTTPDFSLDNLPGGAGRLDLLCRCVTTALHVSHGIREDVRIHLVMADEYTITVDGSEVRRLNPDERSTAARLRGALEHRDEAVGAMAAESSPGIEITRLGVEDTLRELDHEGTLVQLHEDGKPLPEWDPPEDPVFVLSDHHDFTPGEEELLDGMSADRVRLGPTALHGDQAITVAHHYLDTGGYEQF